MSDSSLLRQALFAPGPHPNLGQPADTYSRVVGSWEGDSHDFDEGGATTGPMEVHFGWALEGRAVLDVWVAPTRAARARGPSSARNTYGTTLRFFDPASEAWRVTWFNPGLRVRSGLIGRRVGDDVVQLGVREGVPIKWNFTDVTPRSFTWRGYKLAADGVTWGLEAEFQLRRKA